MSRAFGSKNTGVSKVPGWQNWRLMIARSRSHRLRDRCYIGISVCERWLDFANFIEDMGPRPSKGYTIDRIDSALGYEPDNCRWATRRDQVLNRSTTRWYSYRGLQMCLLDWARRLGISQRRLTSYLNSGCTLEDVIAHLEVSL